MIQGIPGFLVKRLWGLLRYTVMVLGWLLLLDGLCLLV